MSTHILMGEFSLSPGFIIPVHESYLKKWREDAIQNADKGDVAASVCMQAALIDLVIYGKINHDWIGVMDEYLMHDDIPIAYSEVFGKRLHKFDAQYLQSTIHSIHTRWWIEKLSNINSNYNKYANLILSKKQDDGLIYDKSVSETILRHRMKLELTYSMAMSVEILKSAEIFKTRKELAIEIATNIVSQKKCPCLGYISMEYFRLNTLRQLNHEALFPAGISESIDLCKDGLAVGWCDFSIKSKIDAYMGTAKRTQRDKPIHSPLIACHTASLLEKVEDREKQTYHRNRLEEYCYHLKKHPMDIPSFQMRDLTIPFGADKTPIEIICASYLISKCQSH